MASTSGGSNAAPNPTQSDTAVDGGGVGRDIQSSSPVPPAPPSRYESQKRRDWNTFLQYLRNHKPPLSLSRCSGAHVIEFLKYLDQFGKTKVHITGCTYFGHPNPPAPCTCPLKQAWGSLDALIGRLRAAYEENGGRPESNPFGARAVRIYLREVRESQAKARGIPYEKKKRKRLAAAAAAASSVATPALEVSPISTSAPVVESLVGSSAASGGGDASSSSGVGVVVLTTTCTPTVVVASSAAEFS